MPGPVRRLGLVADGRVVEDVGAHLGMVRREGDEEPAAQAMPEARRARGVRLQPLDEVVPGLVHLHEELAVGVLRLQVGALADVVRSRHPEHVEQARHEHVEAEGGQLIRVDLVVRGHPMRVVHHHHPGARTAPLRMRHVAGNAVFFQCQPARDHSHVRSPFSS